MRSAYAWFALALATVAPLAVAAGRPPIDPRRGCRKLADCALPDKTH